MLGTTHGIGRNLAFSLFSTACFDFFLFFYSDPLKLMIACFVFGPTQYSSLCIMTITNLLDPTQLILC